MLEITNLADQAVLLPIAAMVGVLLALSGWRWGTLAWAVGIGATYALVFGLKVVLLQCGAHAVALPIDLRSPSGHTAGAGVVYGALLGLTTSRAGGASRWTAGQGAIWTLACVVPIVILVGWSRLALGVHTLPDVIAGALIGVAGAVAIVVAAGVPRRRPSARVIGLAVLAALALAYGRHAPGEVLIRAIAARLWLDPTCL